MGTLLRFLNSKRVRWLTVQGSIDIQIWQLLLHALLCQHHGLAGLSNWRGNRLVTIRALDRPRLTKPPPALDLQPHRSLRLPGLAQRHSVLYVWVILVWDPAVLLAIAQVPDGP